MSPLMFRVVSGLEDHRLLEHVDILQRLPGRSTGEDQLLQAVWDRLDQITTPDCRVKGS